jgi:hypothetical protein
MGFNAERPGFAPRDPLNPNDLRARIALFLLTGGVSYFPWRNPFLALPLLTADSSAVKDC